MSVVKIDLNQSRAATVRLAARAPHHDLRVERAGERAPLGRRIGMGDRPAEGAAHADGKVRDVMGDGGQELRERTGGDRLLEDDVAGERADREGAALLADAGKAIDAVDVDQHRGARQAKIHRRHQALAARQDPPVSPMLVEKRGGFLDRARRESIRRPLVSWNEA